MGIKTLDELRAIREQNKNSVHLRHGEAYGGESAVIQVGMGTCGIAAGARDTLRALLEAVRACGLENVRVTPVGCVGHCSLEPIVLVYLPEQTPFAYGPVSPGDAALIVRQHVAGGQPVRDLQIHLDLGGDA